MTGRSSASSGSRQDARAITIAAATEADLDGIVEVFLSCWRVSYASVLPAAVVASMTVEEAHRLWAEAVDSDETVLIARDAGGRTRGIVRFPPAVNGAGYVASLYVHPDGQGLGIGHRLLDAALADLRAGGARSATLWVFEANAPSRAFYERRGWRLDGRTRTQPRFATPEVGMTIELTAPDDQASSRATASPLTRPAP